MRFLSRSLVLLAFLATAGPAAAQSALPPLPPPSAPPPSAPPPSQVEPAPPSVGASEPSSPEQAPPGAPYGQAPPRYSYVPPPPGPPSMSQERAEIHAPRTSLWVGARLGALAYMGSLYAIDPDNVETVGNYVQPGLALELDAGARLGRRFIPYVAYEAGLMGAGHRFAQTQTSAGTSFAGIGLRLLSGDVDHTSFMSDVSLGFRRFQVSNPSGTWSATGFEFLRFSVGAEIRLSTLFTLSPALTVSGGSVSDTSGNIAFAPNQGDGLAGPPFHDGRSIAGSQTSYYAFVLGCGAHFDLLGN